MLVVCHSYRLCPAIISNTVFMEGYNHSVVNNLAVKGYKYAILFVTWSCYNCFIILYVMLIDRVAK